MFINHYYLSLNIFKMPSVDDRLSQITYEKMEN